MFTLLVQLWPLFPPEEDGQIKRNNNNFGGKNSPIGLSNNCKVKTYLFSPSNEK